MEVMEYIWDAPIVQSTKIFDQKWSKSAFLVFSCKTNQQNNTTKSCCDDASYNCGQRGEIYSDVRYEDRLIYIVRLGCGNKAEHTRNYSGRNE